MPPKVLLTLWFLIAPTAAALAQEATHAPQLLLNAQRLRRLKRDRERKTTRWVNFENRLQAVPDSPERGFELALYYAITGDEAKGREAIAFALSHDSPRQKALVLDWCAPLLSPAESKKLAGCSAAESKTHFIGARDCAFEQLAAGNAAPAPSVEVLRTQFAWLMNGGFENPEELYALCELIYVLRANTQLDLREAAPHFFAGLPAELLLSAKPREVKSPDWKMHAAALALVAIDPNLPTSQFLQSWALEDAQTLRTGPGVAHELLWADPYLPGVGYQNMEPWFYDDHDTLFARSNWEPDSCWIEISPRGVAEENCPPHWQDQTATFGHLTLLPLTARCVEIPRVANNETVLVWKLKPAQNIAYGKGKEQRAGQADSAGIWHPGATIEGKACTSAH